MREWQVILSSLRSSMTEATFDRLLRGTTAEQRNGKITVYCDNEMAVDWLDNRLRKVVERAVWQHAEGQPEIRFAVAGETKTDHEQTEMFVVGTYEELRNEIIKPHQFHPVTNYFRTQWVPLLGANLAWLIIALRQRCFWNKVSGEKRDSCKTTFVNLAKEIGVTRETVSRMLTGKKRNKYVDLFVREIKPVYAYCNRRGKMVRKHTIFTIQLDEPLTPDDSLLLKDLQKRSLDNPDNGL